MSRLQTSDSKPGPVCVTVPAGEDDVTVLDLEGEIDPATAPDFKAALLQSTADGARRVVVDATRVTFMDSTGLHAVVVGHCELVRPGGSLTIACSDNVARATGGRTTGLRALGRSPRVKTESAARGCEPSLLVACRGSPC